jgi:uncharacterized protein YecT (DUF1311 family)
MPALSSLATIIIIDKDQMKAQVTLFLLAFIASPSVFATDECAKALSHVAQRECLEALAQRSEAKVRSAQAIVLKRIDNWDEDENYKWESRKLIQESGVRFKAFKTSQCELEASSAAGGNGAGDLRLDCQIRLDRQYTAELRRRWGLF